MVQTWTARVEWRDPEITDDALAQIAAALAEQSGAVGRERDPEVASATITVEAGTLRAATDRALRVVRDAVAAVSGACEPTGIEVLPCEVFARRVAEPSIPELVGYPEIADMASVSNQRARQLTELANFPASVVRVRNGKLWVRAQVVAWMAEWDRKPGRRW